MPCLLVLLAFFFPRLVIVLLWLFTTYIRDAFSGVLLPILGFIFLPYTTLVFVWAKISHGSIDGIYAVALVLAVLWDLGVIGGGAKARKKRLN